MCIRDRLQRAQDADNILPGNGGTQQPLHLPELKVDDGPLAVSGIHINVPGIDLGTGQPLQKVQRPVSYTHLTLVDSGSKKQAQRLKEQIALTEQLAKTMGFSLGDKDTSDKERREAERRVKEYLDSIQKQVDEYRKKFDIWNTIYNASGKKPKIDFDITFDGDPDITKYIKAKMQEIGKGKLNLDVNFLTANFEDILDGALFDDQTIEKLRALFNELRDSSFRDYKGLTELYEQYADYTIKKSRLDKKYIEERNKLLRSGASEAVLKEQIRVYREESEKLMMEFANKDKAFNEFVTSLANHSVDKLRFLLMELKASLTKETVTGGDQETILMLRAQITALEERLKTAKVDTQTKDCLLYTSNDWLRKNTSYYSTIY